MAEIRSFGSYSFTKLCEVDVERNEAGDVTTFSPQLRYANVSGLSLHNYGAGPFCKFKLSTIPAASGVYAYLSGDEVLYVGETHLARQTLAAYRHISPRMCFKGGQERSCRINNLIYGAASSRLGLSLWFFPALEYKSIEAELRKELRPKWNRI